MGGVAGTAATTWVVCWLSLANLGCSAWWYGDLAASCSSWRATPASRAAVTKKGLRPYLLIRFAIPARRASRLTVRSEAWRSTRWPRAPTEDRTGGPFAQVQADRPEFDSACSNSAGKHRDAHLFEGPSVRASPWVAVESHENRRHPVESVTLRLR
jgi:hypothetical protein